MSFYKSLSLFYKIETKLKIHEREWINLFEIVFYPMILCNATKGLYNALMKYCGNNFILFAYQRLRLFWTKRNLHLSSVSFNHRLNTKVEYL